MANQVHVEKMIELTGEKQLYLSGLPNHQTIELSLGSVGKIQKELRTAPLLSYTIPYYYTKKTKQILQFEESIDVGKYYLLHTSEIREHHVIRLILFRTGLK